MTTDQNQKEKRRNNIPILFVTLGLAVIGLIVMMGVWMKESKVQRLSIGNEMPDFKLVSFQGDEFTLHGLNGKVVLINFWSSWCSTCDEESYMLQEVWSEVEPSGNIQFLGVDYVDTETPASQFIAEHGMIYPNCPDLGSNISKLFEITGVPETFLIDQNGILKAIQIGPFNSTEDLRDFINQTDNQEEKE